MKKSGESGGETNPTSAAPARQDSRAKGTGNDRGRRMILVIGAAILAVILMASVFTLGYIIGNQNSEIRALTNGVQQGPPAGGPQGTQGQQQQSTQQSGPQGGSQGQQPSSQQGQ
jgi:hypothetical protein